MKNIPIPPNKDNRDEFILNQICERLDSLFSSGENNDWFKCQRRITHEGILSWRIIHELSAAGYSVIPQHGVNIPANDWKDHIDSIYYWTIRW